MPWIDPSIAKGTDMDIHDQRITCLRMAVDMGCKPDSVVQIATDLMCFVTTGAAPAVTAADQPAAEAAPAVVAVAASSESPPAAPPPEVAVAAPAEAPAAEPPVVTASAEPLP